LFQKFPVRFQSATHLRQHHLKAQPAKAAREIDGGKETVSTSTTNRGGQKGLVEEKDLRIPNMRGIMTKIKALTIVEPIEAPANTEAVRFENQQLSLRLISPDNLDELIDLLHNEA
jgi:electron transfer flavoprotein beta subunit